MKTYFYSFILILIFSNAVYAECIPYEKNAFSAKFKIVSIESASSICSVNQNMKRIGSIEIPQDGCIIEYAIVRPISKKVTKIATTITGGYLTYDVGSMCKKKVGDVVDLKLELADCCRIVEAATLAGGPACNELSKKWLKNPSPDFLKCMTMAPWQSNKL
ncbi:hypothetical protein [Bdellovibrio sp. KM01]|uniref:hypothetical protein n=1 Tax=Bdellovibrio sp. KM01 TaxID=2748865 RepID=UPI0015EB0A0C|nr:hypothetical protein [Bdellovibrio sp. KM01]QLY23862.1 hypothetical protein HW988_10180 [Bdellovibrio sp. KM01]